MAIVQVGKVVNLDIKQFEGIDSEPNALQVTKENIGSSYFNLLTGEYWKLNLDESGNLKWYKL